MSRRDCTSHRTTDELIGHHGAVTRSWESERIAILRAADGSIWAASFVLGAWTPWALSGSHSFDRLVRAYDGMPSSHKPVRRYEADD